MMANYESESGLSSDTEPACTLIEIIIYIVCKPPSLPYFVKDAKTDYDSMYSNSS